MSTKSRRSGRNGAVSQIRRAAKSARRSPISTMAKALKMKLSRTPQTACFPANKVFKTYKAPSTRGQRREASLLRARQGGRKRRACILTPGNRVAPETPIAPRPGPPRGNAPRLQPSIRRQLSQFELIDSSPEPEAIPNATPVPAPVPQRKRGRPRGSRNTKKPEARVPEPEATAPQQDLQPPEGYTELTLPPASKRARPGLLIAGAGSVSDQGAVGALRTKYSVKRVAQRPPSPENPSKMTRSGRTVRPTYKIVEAFADQGR